MNRAATLEQLTRLCNLNREGVAPPSIETTGFSALDAALPHRGWPSGTVVELMPTDTGIGELRLLMPALARMTQSERHVALIAPPYIPFAPALIQQGVQVKRLLIIQSQKNEDTLWALEQVLRCTSFGAALAWPASIKDKEVRRLQLAAEAGRSIGFIYRSPHAAREASPAAIRLRLQAKSSGLLIDILKCRGGRGGFSVAVDTRTPVSTVQADALAETSITDHGFLSEATAVSTQKNRLNRLLESAGDNSVETIGTDAPERIASGVLASH